MSENTFVSEETLTTEAVILVSNITRVAIREGLADCGDTDMPTLLNEVINRLTDVIQGTDPRLALVVRTEQSLAAQPEHIRTMVVSAQSLLEANQDEGEAYEIAVVDLITDAVEIDRRRDGQVPDTEEVAATVRQWIEQTG